MAGEDTADPGAAAYRDFAVPEVVAEHSRSWLRRPPADRPAATPRASATVMLLRDDPRLEVFVLRRVAGMAFAAGMVAFPGGGVDPRDAEVGVPWAGPDARSWARRLGTGEAAARQLVTAAAREVFEECGVLLAGRSPDAVVDDLRDEVWRRERAGLLDRTHGFAQVLERHGLVLRTDLLSLRGHWVTPECEPRRYDTRFLAARMPPGQVADDESSEAAEAGWRTPADILQGQREGRDLLLPPTQVMVEELAGIRDLDAWLGQRPRVPAVLPVPVEHDGRLWMRVPRHEDAR
ncbi:NUDIX domain-containing protein [uncultured Serinicoccus sp.]|uniref:NUDIX hydrolase n=1 Tax=uncultured Serinicoccus sp. TaxID=735514 RepID=UPI002611CA3D|nr:NUDIX domain-containing protein [uncultured Serinicoccus sp.]